MAQLIVSLEDNSLTGDIKKAIKMLRGVVSVKECDVNELPNDTTVAAIDELESGNTIVCEDFESYLKLVDGELQD